MAAKKAAAKVAKQSNSTNTIDPALTKSFVERVENLHADLDSEREAYMAKCKVIREDITEVYAEAKAEGLSKKALKATVKRRELEAKAQALANGLEPDDVTAYEQMVEALGDLATLPLGQHLVADGGQTQAPPPIGGVQGNA